jgi:hypothetical protein
MNILLANPYPDRLKPGDKIKPGSLIGLMSENHLCVDCAVNTNPGCPGRVETELAFMDGADSVPTYYDDRSEVYIVRDKVWQAAGMEPYGGCLSALEKRLGRMLRPKDVQRDHPLNHPAMPGTPRLLKRRGRSYA